MANQVRHCFVVTSAVNSKFGVYTPAERLVQTLDTINGIRARVPDCKIIVMECAGTPLTPEQEAALDASADIFVDFTTDPDVQSIYASENWDIVKNTTEIMCFGRTLQMCLDDGDFKDVDRVHKMSGRYLLNDDFKLSVYEEHADRILIGPKYKSQFPIEVTGIELQYMARLWSWPAHLTNDVIRVYYDSLSYIAERIAHGGYADIEHVLYKFLPPELVTEIPLMGVEGTIAPTGQTIKN